MILVTIEMSFEMNVFRIDCFVIFLQHSWYVRQCNWLSLHFCHFIMTSHYSDVIMSAISSQITCASTVCLIVCSGAARWKHQSSASLASVVTGGFSSQMASDAENISMWWRHHGIWKIITSVQRCSVSPNYINQQSKYLVLRDYIKIICQLFTWCWRRNCDTYPRKDETLDCIIADIIRLMRRISLG